MQIQIRISHDGRVFEGDAVLSETASHRGTARVAVASGKRDRATKPAGAVDDLYSKGYFSDERALADVRAQLRKDGYNFSPPAILMALKAREYLQRRGSKGNYRFAQKYPPKSV